MTTRTFTLGTDNIQFKLDKQDKTNTDELELVLPVSTTILISDEVILKSDATTTIFKGLVQSLNTGNGKKVVKVWDYGLELLNRTVNTIYTSQSPEAIIQDVLTNYSSLTYVSTISSGVTLGTYVANKKRAWDIVTEMSELLLSNFRVDYDKKFYLELEGENTITSKVIETPTVILDGQWKSDASQIRNSVTIDGDDRQIFERDPELFNGTGSQTEFTLSEIPLSIKVEHPVGTIKTGYTPGSTTGDYYLDRESKKVIFDSAPASGTNNVKITYTVSVPISSRRRDFVSISVYGQRDKVFKKAYIKTREEARKYAEFIINRYKDPIEESTWILPNSEIPSLNTYLPNSYIYVNDTINSKSGYYIIRSVYLEQPGELKVTVGTPIEDIIYWNKEIQQKVKQLEEKDDNTTLLNEEEYQIENLLMEWDIDILSTEHRVYDSDTFYLSETSITRNQMKDDGSGPIMRDVADGNGYSIQGPIGLYHFTGNANDSGSTGADGTVYGATLTTDKNVYSNQAYSFGGLGGEDYIDLGNNFNFDRTDPFSISMWCNFNTQSDNTLFSKLSFSGVLPSAGLEILQEASGDIRVFFTSDYSLTNAVDIRTSSGAISTSGWYHIVLTHSGSGTAAGFTLYVNNSPVSFTTTTYDNLTTSTLNSNSAYLGIRNRAGNLSNEFDGVMDEVAIYNRELNSTEVGILYANYDSNFTPLDKLDSSAVTSTMHSTARTNFITSILSLVSHIGVGDDNTTPTEGDTTLGNQTLREATFSESSTSLSASFSIFLDTTENNSNSIEEIGLFDASSGGNMYQHLLTNITAKTSSIEWFGEIKINVTVANNSTLQ